MSDPALPRVGDRGEVDAVQQPREPVTAAQHQPDVGVVIGGDPDERGQPFVVRGGKTLPATARRRIATDAMTESFEACDRATDRMRIGRESGRRQDGDSPCVLSHAKPAGAVR